MSNDRLNKVDELNAVRKSLKHIIGAIAKVHKKIENREPTVDEKRRLDIAESDRGAFERRIVALENQIQQLDTQAAERREFWVSRFHLSLAVANGAALAAVASKIYDQSIASGTTSLVWWAMVIFSFGLSFAGVLPVALYFQWKDFPHEVAARFQWRNRAPWTLATASAVLFASALALLVTAAAQSKHIDPSTKVPTVIHNITDRSNYN